MGLTSTLGAPLSADTARLDRIYEEVAFVAYHFHWSHDDVLALPHWERRRWCAEISRINERLADGSEGV